MTCAYRLDSDYKNNLSFNLLVPTIVGTSSLSFFLPLSVTRGNVIFRSKTCANSCLKILWVWHRCAFNFKNIWNQNKKQNILTILNTFTVIVPIVCTDTIFTCFLSLLWNWTLHLSPLFREVSLTVSSSLVCFRLSVLSLGTLLSASFTR